MKPYFQDDAVTIYNCDCREILPQLPKVDLVLTDPPYGGVNRESNGLRNLDKGCADIETLQLTTMVPLLQNHANSYYIWCGTEQVSQIRFDFIKAGCSTRLCIWEKTNPSPMNGEHIFLSAIECCVFAKYPKAYFNALCISPVFRGATEDKQEHPTQKPEWLMGKLIQISCPPSGLILDPFMGSGTTLRAAKNLGRKAIGIEIEEKYCEIAARRMAQMVMPL